VIFGARGIPEGELAMSSWRHVLGGVAAVGLFGLIQPDISGAANLREGVDPGFGRPLERVVFHGHAPRNTSYYCYPRNYWWFYRPYTTANDGYARCMPYFHYPPHRGRG
jgi:hypothetical protein